MLCCSGNRLEALALARTPDDTERTVVDYRVSAQERAAFTRCRRQWDFGSAPRQNLETIQPRPVTLNQAVRDALAMYYYPGMWDWPSHIVLPLVRKAFMRTMATAPTSAQRTEDVDLGTELVEQYIAWAPGIDDFCPLKIETDVESLVPDVREPGRGLLADGRRVVYTDRIALLAMDSADECWVTVHQVVPVWQDIETLLLDEAAVSACWAWEHTYLGMDIAGTIHNEILSSPVSDLGPAPEQTLTGRPGRGGYSHNEASGGGRLTLQLQRLDRLENRAADEDRVRQETAGIVRRTKIRRSRAEIETNRQRVGAEILEMLNPELNLYPAPSPAHCRECMFVAPCLTMMEGGDPAMDLATRFRLRPADTAYEPRLGSGGGGGRYVPLTPRPPTPPA